MSNGMFRLLIIDEWNRFIRERNRTMSADDKELADSLRFKANIHGQEVSSADVRLSTGTKTIQFHGLDPVTKRAIVMPLVDLVFNVDATAEQVETAKSAIAHLIGIGVDVPKTAPSVVPVDIQDGSLGNAACRAMPARDWHTREVLQKIPMEDWGTVAQAVINKYWELSAVPGQPAG